MLGWFKALPSQGKALMVLIVVVLGFVAVMTLSHLVDALTETAEQKGAVVERVQTQGKVIENVQTANEARDAVSDPRSCAMYRECLQSARTTANCVRYLPHDEGCAVQPGASGGN